MNVSRLLSSLAIVGLVSTSVAASAQAPNTIEIQLSYKDKTFDPADPQGYLKSLSIKRIA